MNKVLLFLKISLFFLFIGCASINNTTNESNSKEIKSKKNIPVADNTVNTSVSQRKKVDNNGFVTTNVEMQQNKLIITYKNTTEKTVHFGDIYFLQLLKNNTWTKVPELSNVGYDLIRRKLLSHNTYIDTVELKNIYGELDTGHYKIIKEMYIDSTYF